MLNPEKQIVVWVKRDTAEPVPDSELRERAGVEDAGIEVRTESLARWDFSKIPSGSRDEWGVVLPGALNIGHGQLPPEGRVYLIFSA